MPNAGRSAQLLFKQAFHPGLAFVVSQPVPAVAVHVFPVHFPVLAHNLACDAKHVLTNGFGADGQARIPPQLRRHGGVFLGVELAQQRGRFVARIPACLGESFVQLLPNQPHQCSEGRSVHVGQRAGHHHQVVTRHVVHEQFPVAVEAKSPRRLQDFLLFRQPLRTVLPVVRGDLHLEQPKHKQQPHSEHHGPHDALPARKLVAVQLHG